MERYAKDSLFTPGDTKDDDDELTLEQQFSQPLPDLEKLEGNVCMEHSDDDDYAPPAFGDAGAHLEADTDVKLLKSKLNYALVSMVAPEGTPQKSPMMAFKIRGAFDTYEKAVLRQRKIVEYEHTNGLAAFAIWIVKMNEDIPFPPRSTTAEGQREEQTETQAAYRRSNSDFQARRDKRIETAKKGIDEAQDINKVKDEEGEAYFQEMTLEPARIKSSVMKTKVQHEPEADPPAIRVENQEYATLSVLCHRLYNDPELKDKYGKKEMRYLFRVVAIEKEEKDALRCAEDANELEEDHDFTVVELWDWVPFPPPPGGIRYMYRNKPEMQAKLDYLYATLEKRGNEVAGPSDWMAERDERISHLMMNLPTPEELEEISRQRLRENEEKKKAEEAAQAAQASETVANNTTEPPSNLDTVD
jgi:hypothetical protein